MIGTKINKPVETAAELNEYSQLAEWCNANGAVIEDRGDHYEVCKAPEPEAPEAADIAAEIADLKQRLSALEAMLDGDLR